jgi:hypothetical protein
MRLGQGESGVGLVREVSKRLGLGLVTIRLQIAQVIIKQEQAVSEQGLGLDLISFFFLERS